MDSVKVTYLLLLVVVTCYAKGQSASQQIANVTSVMEKDGKPKLPSEKPVVKSLAFTENQQDQQNSPPLLLSRRPEVPQGQSQRRLDSRPVQRRPGQDLDQTSYKPYSFNYLAQDENGSSTHQQAADANGRVVGSYSVALGDGRKRVVEYIADEHGFRANVDTNEPGTSYDQSPADARFYSSASGASRPGSRGFQGTGNRVQPLPSWGNNRPQIPTRRDGAFLDRPGIGAGNQPQPSWGQPGFRAGGDEGVESPRGVPGLDRRVQPQPNWDQPGFRSGGDNGVESPRGDFGSDGRIQPQPNWGQPGLRSGQNDGVESPRGVPGLDGRIQPQPNWGQPGLRSGRNDGARGIPGLDGRIQPQPNWGQPGLRSGRNDGVETPRGVPGLDGRIQPQPSWGQPGLRSGQNDGVESPRGVPGLDGRIQPQPNWGQPGLRSGRNDGAESPRGIPGLDGRIQPQPNWGQPGLRSGQNDGVESPRGVPGLGGRVPFQSSWPQPGLRSGEDGGVETPRNIPGSDGRLQPQPNWAQPGFRSGSPGLDGRIQPRPGFASGDIDLNIDNVPGSNRRVQPQPSWGQPQPSWGQPQPSWGQPGPRSNEDGLLGRRPNNVGRTGPAFGANVPTFGGQPQPNAFGSGLGTQPNSGFSPEARGFDGRIRPQNNWAQRPTEDQGSEVDDMSGRQPSWSRPASRSTGGQGSQPGVQYSQPQVAAIQDQDRLPFGFPQVSGSKDGGPGMRIMEEDGSKGGPMTGSQVLQDTKSGAQIRQDTKSGPQIRQDTKSGAQIRQDTMSGPRGMQENAAGAYHHHDLYDHGHGKSWFHSG